MRRKVILLASVVSLGSAIVWFWLGANKSGAPLRIGIEILGYSTTNSVTYLEFRDDVELEKNASQSVFLSTWPPPNSSRIETNRSVILVKVRLKNLGPQAIGYESTSQVPEYTCRVNRHGTWMKVRDYHNSGGPMVMLPSHSLDFTVWLPPDTTAWQFGFVGTGASARNRTVQRLLDSGWLNRFPQPLLLLLPGGEGSYEELLSEVFEIPKAAP